VADTLLESGAERASDGTTPWHTLGREQVLAALHVGEEGLTSGIAKQRRDRFGPNVLVEGRQRSAWRILIAQLADVMVLILIASAIVSALLGETHDVIAILAIVVLNAILGVVQEIRAERAIAALKAMSAPSARVRRDGSEMSCPSSDVVPGDIVVLEAGSIVPADVRLLDAHRLRVEEAALTGESQPVEKSVAPLVRADVPIGERLDMAYKGTIVTYGRGLAVAVETGMRTELGRIALMLGSEEGRRTPLQNRLARFGRHLAIIVLVLCGVVFGAGVLRGEQPVLMFMTAISLAVAAVPEALPAVVTVALALGARAMVRQNALIRRLPAVETLGSVTYICCDKTGTLTENRMRVEAVQTGQSPAAPLADQSDDVVLALLLQAIALNNDATLGADGTLSGDPTETALHRAAAGAGHRKEALELGAPRIAEVPFSSERARMTTVHRGAHGVVAYTKGAPERVLKHCVDRIGADGAEPLDRDGVLLAADRMAASGLRVLAIAMRRIAHLPSEVEAVESEQSFVGLVGLMDPPRAEARESVALCQSAGIHVVMITGDHPSTARAIAERLGIASDGDVVVTGSDLKAMSSEELDARVGNLRVFARVAPEDKIRIVAALQHRGESVAMTGDGVNDAPALSRADIGVAMGRGGTDVAREAAHMVLLDDDFATIVKAVREGRRIYDNIRRFVRYELSTNSGEVWTLVLAPFFGLPLPLLPIHILWMNLVTDGLPGLALTAEPPERDVMSRPPRAVTESILAHGLWQHAVWVGLLMAALALGTQAWTIHVADAHWQSMTFTVLTLSQLAHVLAIRSERESLLRLGLRSNLPLLAAVALTVLLQMAALYVPPLTRVFRTTALSAAELAACIALSSTVFFAVEIEKWMIRRGWLYASYVPSSSAR